MVGTIKLEDKSIYTGDYLKQICEIPHGKGEMKKINGDFIKGVFNYGILESGSIKFDKGIL